MTHASVFSGIGGPEVAATMLGWENLFHCEINPFGRKVLDYWYPNSKSYEDITTTDFTEWRGRVDVLTGGFPCQPFSYAGRRRGAEDDRYLWPHMHRCINEIQPTWFIGENVAGILTMVEQGEVSKVAGSATLFDAFDDLRGRYELRETFTLQRICTDLESHGYAVQPVLVPACAVGAPHRRDRVFIVGHRLQGRYRGEHSGVPEAEGKQSRTTADTNNDRLEHGESDKHCGRENTPTRSEGDGAERFVLSETSGGIRTPADTSDARAEGVRQERQNAVHRPQSIADTDCDGGLQVHEHMEPEQPNGAITFGNGWEWNSPNPRWDFSSEGQWLPTQSPVHRGHDGISIRLDNLAIPFTKWRNESIKAYGNAIVPQVMYEIFRAIEIVEQGK